MVDFETFAKACEQRGLSAISCTENHWQIGDGGGAPLVNYWPTTNKALRYNAKQGHKVYPATYREAIEDAARLADGTIPRQLEQMERDKTAPVNGASQPHEVKKLPDRQSRCSARILCVQYEGDSSGVGEVLAQLLKAFQ